MSYTPIATRPMTENKKLLHVPGEEAKNIPAIPCALKVL